MTALPETHWSADYLGLPWVEGGLDRSGCSCWGLARLPAYGDTIDAAEAREIDFLLGRGGSWPWVPVDREDMQPFDLVTLAIGGVEGHAASYRRRTWPDSIGERVEPERRVA